MILLATALLLQAAPVASDTTETDIYDTPATRALVERAIEVSGALPDGLNDYRARIRSRLHVSVAADGGEGAETPLAVDEMETELRWRRPDRLFQRVTAHRVRVRATTPYTLGTLLEAPWVLPHLYGSGIDVLDLAAGERPRPARAAVHPFGSRGPDVYRYEAGDSLRIRAGGETVTVVPIIVRPRERPTETVAVGTFYLDTERAAIARARFMIREPARRLRISETASFMELDNALWDGRFWLPFRQRFEVQITSGLLGGAVAARVVNEVASLEPNVGVAIPAGRRHQLAWETGADPTAFEGWPGEAGADAAEFDIGDWDDLRRTADGVGGTRQGLRIVPAAERGAHILRYNRVEGAFLGAGARVEPADPARRRWDLYGTGGWAFAEGTSRGELRGRWRSRTSEPADDPTAPAWFAEAGAYRRLADTRAFLPTVDWDFLYHFGALLDGADERDYVDTRGGEAALGVRSGGWTARLGARREGQAQPIRNTTRSLFREAPRFPPVAAVDAGTHTALEGEVRHTRGSGSFGVSRSTVASLRGVWGVGDFRYRRLIGTLSLRRPLGPLQIASRLDAARVWGAAPPQALPRFGGVEGLRGFDTNQFGGSTALLGRGRLLLPIPPRSAAPAYRAGIFLVPPLRPAVVLLGEAGWSDVTEEHRPALNRLGSATTGDGAGPPLRGTYGAGVSIFDDVLSLEYVRPTGDGPGRWRFGFVQWF